MEKFNINEYNAERFSSKMYLENFTIELHNSFETSADNEIEMLIKKIDNLKKKYNNFDLKNIKEKTEEEIMNAEVEKYYSLIDIESVKEEIWALIDMKIIYSFKFLEINIKKLIRKAFHGTKTKDFYKWDSLNNFLKGKNIKPSKLNGYLEVTQIKDVNNSLKHSEELKEDIKKRIPEFKNKKIISFNDLNLFYKRTKDMPKIYLDELASAIQTELYEFNEQKINKIADNIACRMEKNDAELLIKAIKSKY